MCGRLQANLLQPTNVGPDDIRQSLTSAHCESMSSALTESYAVPLFCGSSQPRARESTSAEGFLPFSEPIELSL